MDTNAITEFEAIEQELAGETGAKRGKVFGMSCLKIGGKVFVGLGENSLVFKLGGDGHARAMALPGAHLYDPMGMGRPMKEWVEVPVENAAHYGELAREALGYVGEKVGRES